MPMIRNHRTPGATTAERATVRLPKLDCGCLALAEGGCFEISARCARRRRTGLAETTLQGTGLGRAFQLQRKTRAIESAPF
jgi:hypothetical protein